MRSLTGKGAAARPLTRRSMLGASSALVATFAIGGRAAAADQKVVIRTTSGGSYGEAMEKAIFAPFTQATGIAVEKTPSAMAPLIASVQQGQPLVDVVDTSEGLLQTLAANQAVATIDYDRFKSFAVADIGKDAAQPGIVRRMVYARVLGYRKAAFKGAAPSSWAEFWDVKTFPAARAISGLGLNAPDLEFALIADGVAPSKLYPLDIPRALASMTKIRANIQSFYGTDAISENLLSTGEVDLEAIANGRIQGLIDNGGGFAIEWNEHMKVPSGYSILKGAKNLDNAYRFLDYAMSAEVQARFATLIPYGPVNTKAFAHIAEEFALKLPTNPKWTEKGFMQDAKWWGDNLPAVTTAWNAWAAAK
ncbi:ABC transporter substrate-binding protein [Bosea sp. (in: a-proteobacteria)]|uniref:ABC transporter substrate-binding protein n=1 Tax=Bosea sp. (in: a-proteobacteria) TaxID=1871050 RepID=UPI0026039793|nr:ABC transporter substrate-binding protein [Bosea sp. (in: a-proteobacteria)]MCO5089941.1 ABC transporter substrate-binding protein [Bosea sp. (in: a-proteobacteria)]